MKEAIATTWIYQIVIIFILIFVSFLVLTLSYSKGYKNKNEVLSVIEKYEGVTSDSLGIINSYLSYNNYNLKGHCPSGKGWYGVTNLNSASLSAVKSNEKYYYCLQRKNTPKTSNLNGSKVYYNVKMFFRFNLPVLGNLKTFTIDGTTNDVFLNSNDLIGKNEKS